MAKLLRTVALIRYRAAISLFGLRSLSGCGAARRACRPPRAVPRILSKQDEALLESLCARIAGGAGVAAGTHHPGVRFGSHRCWHAGNTSGRAVGLPATRHARQCPPHADRRGGRNARDRQLPGVPAPRRRGPGTGGSFAGRSTLELSCSPAHGTGSGTRHRPLKARNASRQQISDSLLNCAPFRRRLRFARWPGTPGTGEGRGYRTPQHPSKMER